jgi:hypothetical protein
MSNRINGLLLTFCCASAVLVVGCLDLDLCFPSSEHPLSDDATSIDDDRLVGRWDDGDPQSGQLVVEKIAGMPGHYLVTGLEGVASNFTLVCTEIDQEKFARIESDKGDKKATLPDGFLFAYEIKYGNEWCIYRPENAPLAKAVRAGSLAGTVEFYPKSKKLKSIAISPQRKTCVTTSPPMPGKHFPARKNSSSFPG